MALIAGSTASGKSALALELAERCGGVIIDADSAQIYRDLPLLSAAPSEEERSRAEHRLYGVRDGADPCSAADWASLARTEILDLQASGRLPILVGGTGLYLLTLLDGIAPVPRIKAEIREQVRTSPVEENRRRLAELDPGAATRLNPADTTRIARSLEVVLSSGRPLADWQSQRKGGIGSKIALQPLILLPPRQWLYARCDERFARMVDGGAIDEVERLLDRKLAPSLPVMRAIGVREISAFLTGEISREQAVARGQQATRNYAKRQYTWFAHQPPAHWPRFSEGLGNATTGHALALLQPKA